MAVFKQRGSRFWWVSIYRPGGKRRYFSTGTTDVDAARAMESAVKSAMRGNVSRDRLHAVIDSLVGWQDDGGAGVPVSELWPLYLQSKPTVTRDTLSRRRRICNQFCRWSAAFRPGIRSLDDVSARDAQAFADWLALEHPASGKAQNNRIGNLKTVFKAVAVRAGLSANPFDLVQRADESESRSGRAFTPAEEKRLLAVCKEHGDWLAVSMVARFTGLRYKDIALLHANDLQDGWIRVRPNKTAKRGIVVQIPVHKKIAEFLTGDGLLFPDHSGRYYDGFQKPTGYNDLIRLAEIEPRGAVLSFHCWRHTFRTRLAEAGVSQDVAMKLGGWTEKTTAEIYNHDLTQIEAAIRAMG